MRRIGATVAVIALVAALSVAAVHQLQPAWWLRLWYPLDYQTQVTGYAKQYNLRPDLVAAVIYKESRFKASARSKAGAVGLMQLLPDTAEGIAIHTGGTQFDPDTDLLDVDLNVRYGCWYLRHLMDKYDRYPNGHDLALAAYNAGQANVDGWIADRTPGGRVRIPFRETRDYVDSLNELTETYRTAYGAELDDAP